MEIFNNWVIIIVCLMLMTGILYSLVMGTIRNGISPMPSSFKAKAAIISLFPVNLNGKIYELGSGWGTLVFPLAKHYPQCQIVGFETSFLPYAFSQMWLKITRQKNIEIINKNFFEEKISDSSLVVCYLYPGAMKKLKDKLEKELSPGTLVISNTFSIPGWKEVKVVETHDIYHSKIYLYISHALPS